MAHEEGVARLPSRFLPSAAKCELNTIVSHLLLGTEEIVANKSRQLLQLWSSVVCRGDSVIDAERVANVHGP